VIGLVDADRLKPGDLVGVNKDSYLILETLPAEYDARVKAMEVDERPTEQYSDIGGLDKQIQEVNIIVYKLPTQPAFIGCVCSQAGSALHCFSIDNTCDLRFS